MVKSSGRHVASVQTPLDFSRVAGDAFDSGQTLPQMLLDACRRHTDRPAFSNPGKTLSFTDVERLSSDLASYLRHGLGLASAERVAIMMPNVLQFPVAVLGTLRADCNAYSELVAIPLAFRATRGPSQRLRTMPFLRVSPILNW